MFSPEPRVRIMGGDAVVWRQLDVCLFICLAIEGGLDICHLSLLLVASVYECILFIFKYK